MAKIHSMTKPYLMGSSAALINICQTATFAFTDSILTTNYIHHLLLTIDSHLFTESAECFQIKVHFSVITHFRVVCSFFVHNFKNTTNSINGAHVSCCAVCFGIFLFYGNDLESTEHLMIIQKLETIKIVHFTIINMTFKTVNWGEPNLGGKDTFMAMMYQSEAILPIYKRP